MLVDLSVQPAVFLVMGMRRCVCLGGVSVRNKETRWLDMCSHPETRGKAWAGFLLLHGSVQSIPHVLARIYVPFYTSLAPFASSPFTSLPPLLVSSLGRG